MPGEKRSMLDFLRALPVFRFLDHDELASIDDLGTVVDLDKDQELTHQGASSREFVILLDGQAQVVRDGHDVAVVGPGSFVGEIGLLEGIPRTATVTATTPVRALVFDWREFDELLERRPDMREKIERTAAERHPH